MTDRENVREKETMRPTAHDLSVEADILEAHAKEIVRKGQALSEQGRQLELYAQRLRGART